MTTQPERTERSDDDALPQWMPAPNELDDLELALLGVDLEVTVRLPAGALDPLPGAGDAIALTDPEGTPLGRMEVERADADGSSVVLTGPVAPMKPPEHGPFRRLRRTAAEARADAEQREVLAVPVDQPLQVAHVEAMQAARAGRRLLLLPLVGAGSPRLLPGAALVRATIAATTSLDDVDVVPVPLARRDDPAEDLDLRTRTARAFGASDVLDLDDVPDAEPVQRTTERLRAGEAPAHVFAPAVEAAVLAAFRPTHQQGVVLLLTGLSGSGKSTVARALAERIDEGGERTITLLDGDVVRRMLSAGLSFSRPDRELNVRRIGFVAAEIARHGGLVICAPIAPYAAVRADVRAMVTAAGASFVLVHISTPLAECERRDRKGLYAKARAGLIPEFTGISDPYEEPTDADLAIDTTDVSVDDAVERITAYLEARGFLRPARPGTTERAG